ncbi:Ribokinase-like protein [Pisolithus orientalis]|uniref:Ribokinase-like protein n=1 Tax=Pisolithus orientalis TaxID=936130 RepID=UPI002224ED6F|nr:Ribokinase-like protein [Pisolithus orientalis]KAI6012672.1 Ribokinase-like protein [Pisolithus orientalis]
MATVPTYKLFCIGNPLLDIQVRGGEALLEKYGLKANDAVLAEERHMPMHVRPSAHSYDELVQNYPVTYVAGGGSQNAARAAAYVLLPDSVVYVGCVGDDEFADRLRAANKREGLHDRYLVKTGERTGACAVILTGYHRSLVPTLRAAEKFEKSHLSSPEVAPLVDAAGYIYVDGYFLTHGTESVFALNLAAPFIAQSFIAQLQSVLPYCDIIIGNETEAEAYASATGLPEPKNLVLTARAIALLPKANPKQPRIVVITRGPEPTVLVSSVDSNNVKVYKVTPIPDSLIVDTNGDGDAFAGGFLSALIAGKNLDECVEVGHKMGAMCVQMVGPQFKWPKVQIL